MEYCQYCGELFVRENIEAHQALCSSLLRLESDPIPVDSQVSSPATPGDINNVQQPLNNHNTIETLEHDGLQHTFQENDSVPVPSNQTSGSVSTKCKIITLLESMRVDHNVPESTISFFTTRMAAIRKESSLDSITSEDWKQMGDTNVRKKVINNAVDHSCPIKEKKVQGCNISWLPLREVLGLYLSFADVYEYVVKKKDFADNTLLHGSVFRSILAEKGDRIPLILYVDDADFRKRRNRSYTYVYISLGSLPYWIRSQNQHNILVQVITPQMRNCLGLKKCMQPLITEINKLNRGCNIWIPGKKEELFLRFTLLCCLGDNKGILELVGLSTSFSSCLHICRNCLVGRLNLGVALRHYPLRTTRDTLGQSNVHENVLEGVEEFDWVAQVTCLKCVMFNITKVTNFYRHRLTSCMLSLKEKGYVN